MVEIQLKNRGKIVTIHSNWSSMSSVPNYNEGFCDFTPVNGNVKIAIVLEILLSFSKKTPKTAAIINVYSSGQKSTKDFADNEQFPR